MGLSCLILKCSNPLEEGPLDLKGCQLYMVIVRQCFKMHGKFIHKDLKHLNFNIS